MSGPTPELLRHARARRATRQVADADGAIGIPWLLQCAPLYRLEARGTISPTMARAGERFAELFHLASLNPLKAADMARIPGVGRYKDLPSMVESAQQRVHEAIQACGGHGSPAGECCWRVLGTGMTLQSWATREGWGGRSVSPNAAAGILVATLGVLSLHFGLERRG